jgi:Protein of unknown function DUF72
VIRRKDGRGVLPEGGKKRADELAYYARFFNFVEINSTFYRPASPTMARRWLERTPADFTFAVKVWQKFTHPIRLGDGELREKLRRFERSDVERFIEGIGPLAEVGRLGRCYFNILRAFPAMRRISSGWRQRSLLSMFPRGSSNCAIEAGATICNKLKPSLPVTGRRGHLSTNRSFRLR